MKHSSIDGELRRQGLLRYVLLLGLFFTLKGYQSLDGDQAYRLPLLLHRQDSSVYADDPFVRSFDDFNPHRGSLLVLDVLTRVLGLAPGLLFLFVLTFLTTCWGIDQIARATWPEDRSAVGIVAICLLLVAKAGNIGTNHLFEAMLLDRVMGLSLGWLAIGWLLSDLDHGWPKAAVALGLSTLIHPSLGLQFILIVSGACVVLAVVGGPAGVGWSKMLKVVMALSVAATPGLYINLWSGQSLLAGLSASDFWTLAVELQSPQHMLPHLWRMPQWLAWLSYLGLALLPGDGMRSRSRAAVESDPKASNGWPVARVRLLVILGVVLVWLAGSWVAIERLHQARFTVFQ